LQVDGSAHGASGTFYITFYDSSFTGNNKKYGTFAGDVFQNSEGFSVSPNPTNGLINLRYYSNQSEQINIFVTDLAGKLIVQKQLKKTSGNIELEYNLKGLLKGMYFINVRGNNSTQTRKLVIQ
jgi:hypothetical protein